MNHPNANQQCPDCGSPFQPCKCGGDDRISRFGSTLKVDPAKKLKVRTLEEKFGDDPLMYGPAFKLVRTLLCFGIEWLGGHKCKPGYAPATAHHPGKDDLDGLVPVCGWLHDRCAERTLEVERELREAGSPPLSGLGRMYTMLAIRELVDREELPPELLTAAQKRGLV